MQQRTVFHFNRLTKDSPCSFQRYSYLPWYGDRMWIGWWWWNLDLPFLHFLADDRSVSYHGIMYSFRIMQFIESTLLTHIMLAMINIIRKTMIDAIPFFNKNLIVIEKSQHVVASKKLSISTFGLCKSRISNTRTMLGRSRQWMTVWTYYMNFSAMLLM